jgi:hypothetical protein
MIIQKYGATLLGLGVLFFCAMSNADYRIKNGYDKGIIVRTNEKKSIMTPKSYIDYTDGDAPKSLNVSSTITGSPSRSVSLDDAVKKMRETRASNPNKKPVYIVLPTTTSWQLAFFEWE